MRRTSSTTQNAPLTTPDDQCPSWCSITHDVTEGSVEHALDIPCAVPDVSLCLYRVDDAIDPTASIPTSVLLSVGSEVAVLTATEARTLVRRIAEAARILDVPPANRHDQ